MASPDMFTLLCMESMLVQSKCKDQICQAQANMCLALPTKMRKGPHVSDR